MTVIVTAAQKGGVGKTTITAHMAVAAVLGGSRVGVVDLDPQGSLIEWWNRRSEKDLKLAQVGSGVGLADVLPKARDAVDYVFIDTPPGGDEANLRWLVDQGDIVLIPLNASALDVLAIRRTVDIIKSSGRPMVFLINRTKPRAKITSEIAMILSKRGPVLENEIYDRTLYGRVMGRGQCVWEVDEKDCYREIQLAWAEITSMIDSSEFERNRLIAS